MALNRQRGFSHLSSSVVAERYAPRVRADVGIIGGTGIGSRLAELGGSPVHIPTAEGVIRGRLLHFQGRDLFLLQRHSAGHKVPPHRVNYLGMALALRSLGVRGCLATAAVGSLRREWGAGTLGVCSDFVDLSGRNLTLFERTVEHRDFSHPMGSRTRDALLAAAAVYRPGFQPNVNYVCLNGPRYEAPAEIRSLQILGGDVVGMTAASESIAMGEAGIDYGCLAIVTNLAAGISEAKLDHSEVVEEMERSGETAVKILLEAAAAL